VRSPHSLPVSGSRNRGSVVQLCTQLDGLPLAIELAAMRLRSLSVSQIVERLDRRFHLLGSDVRGCDGRHRSLRALIDWSYELCTPDERVLWARLAVLPAAVDLVTIEAVCGFGDLSADQLLVSGPSWIRRLTPRTGCGPGPGASVTGSNSWHIG
jgi:predicted ATPase